MQTIIQTRADLDAATPQQQRDFLTWLQGAAVNRQNMAVYPDDYDSMTTQPGDPEYIATDWQDVENTAVLQRYGFDSLERVAQHLQLLD